MARSIWTQEERDLLVPYVAQYKSGDEDSRILLLEHKVIPKFLAKFPPRLAESDADEAGNHEGDLREVKRHTKQKIRGWFIKKAPTNVSLTPRRKPRARDNPEEREMLKHYIELYRMGTEQSRKILLTTRVLPEYIRQFHPFGNVNTLSQEQKTRYKKYVRDWLTIEAYYRDEGEQDPELGLHLSLDTIPHSESDDGESPSVSPSPSVRRKRRISPSRDESPTTTKKQKTSANTTTRAPAGSIPSRKVRWSPSATPRRPAARSSTPPRESAVPPSPPQTPVPKVHFAQSSRYNARNIMYSTAVTGFEEGSEPDLEYEPKPEPEEDAIEAEPEPEYDPEVEPEYELAPEPQSGTASRRKSRFRARNRSPTSSPQLQQEQDVDNQGAEDQDEEYQEEEERMMPLEEETLREDMVMLHNSDEEDAVMQDEEDLLQEDDLQEDESQEVVVVQPQEEDPDDALDDREEEQQRPERRLRKRSLAAPPPIHINESDVSDRTPGEVAPSARRVDPLVLSNIGQPIRASLYDQLKEVLTPLFHQQILAVITEFTAQGPPQVNLNAVAHSKPDGHNEHHEDNRRNQQQVNATVIEELEQARKEIQELKQQKNGLGSQAVHMYENTSNFLTGLETQCHALSSQVNRLSKSVKDLYEGLSDMKSRKTKSRRARDSTARASGGAGAASPSAPRTQPAAVEALVGRFRKVIGAQVTVTYYLAKLPRRPLEEAVWRSLDDFVRLPNSAIILGVFHAQAEAEGLNLSNAKDDYVYLRDAILAGWDSDGTVHRRA